MNYFMEEGFEVLLQEIHSDQVQATYQDLNL